MRSIIRVDSIPMCLVSLQEEENFALAGAAQLVGASSRNRRVAGSILVRARTQAVGLIPGPGTGERAADPCFSLALKFLSFPFSLTKRNEKMSSDED